MRVGCSNFYKGWSGCFVMVTRRGWGFSLLVLGIAWAILGIIIYSAVIPTIGGICDRSCQISNFISFLLVVVPAGILLVVSVLLFVRKR